MSLNLFLTHAQIACYELKGDLSPVILNDSFENFEIYKDLYGKPCKRDRPFAIRGHVTSFLWKWKLYEKRLVGHVLNKIISDLVFQTRNR